MMTAVANAQKPPMQTPSKARPIISIAKFGAAATKTSDSSMKAVIATRTHLRLSFPAAVVMRRLAGALAPSLSVVSTKLIQLTKETDLATGSFNPFVSVVQSAAKALANTALDLATLGNELSNWYSLVNSTGTSMSAAIDKFTERRSEIIETAAAGRKAIENMFVLSPEESVTRTFDAFGAGAVKAQEAAGSTEAAIDKLRAKFNELNTTVAPTKPPGTPPGNGFAAVASIKGQSSKGGGGGGRSSSTSSSAAPAPAAPTATEGQNLHITGMKPGDIFTYDTMRHLIERINRVGRDNLRISYSLN